MEQEESSGTEQSGDSGHRGGFQILSLPTSLLEDLFPHDQDSGMSRDKSASLSAAKSKE